MITINFYGQESGCIHRLDVRGSYIGGNVSFYATEASCHEYLIGIRNLAAGVDAMRSIINQWTTICQCCLFEKAYLHFIKVPLQVLGLQVTGLVNIVFYAACADNKGGDCNFRLPFKIDVGHRAELNPWQDVAKDFTSQVANAGRLAY